MAHLDAGELQFPTFNPEQEKFVYTRYPFVCGSGGYGSGKTTALVCKAILLLCDSPWFGDCSGAEGLLGRSKMLDFEKTTLPELFRWLPRHWIKPRGWDKKRGILELINYSVLHLTHLESEEHLQSYNIGFAGIDQMEQVPESVFDCLSLERIRRKAFRRYYPKSQGGGIIVPKFDKDTGDCISTIQDEIDAVVKFRTVFGVCNPKQCWIREKFYDNEQYKDSSNLEVRAKYNIAYKYLHIPTIENRGNLPTNYIETQRTNKTLREYARDVEGSWDSWEGKVYIGCTRAILLGENIVPDPAWDIYIGLDYGGGSEDKTYRTNVKAAVFVAYRHNVGGYPNIFVFDELYMMGVTIERFMAALDVKLKNIYIAQCEKYPDVMEYTADGRVKVYKWVCDPSMANRKANEKATRIIIDDYKYHANMRGITMRVISGNNDVDKGISDVDFMFRKGILKISPKCQNTFKEHMGYEYGENGKPKVLQKDHTVDCLRYVANGFPREFNMRIEFNNPKTIVDRELERYHKNIRQVKSRNVYNLSG